MRAPPKKAAKVTHGRPPVHRLPPPHKSHHPSNNRLPTPSSLSPKSRRLVPAPQAHCTRQGISRHHQHPPEISMRGPQSLELLAPKTRRESCWGPVKGSHGKTRERIRRSVRNPLSITANLNSCGSPIKSISLSFFLRFLERIGFATRILCLRRLQVDTEEFIAATGAKFISCTVHDSAIRDPVRHQNSVCRI